MMPKLIVRQVARDDVVRIAARIALDKMEPALRFTEAAESAFTFLAEHSGVGAKFYPPLSSSADLRLWPITRFDRPLENGAEILRVIHGARDLPNAIFQP